MICGHCGSEVKDGFTVCASCGANLRRNLGLWTLGASFRGLLRLSVESYAKPEPSYFWPPVFTCEKDVCPSEG